MKRITTFSFLLGLIALFATEMQAQVGVGFSLTHDYAFYRNFRAPGDEGPRQLTRKSRSMHQIMDVMPGVDAGFFLATPKAGMFSLHSGIVYTPFSRSKHNLSGEGAFSIPLLFRYSRYGGAYGVGAGFTIGGGAMLTKTALYAKEGGDAVAPNNPLYVTWVGEVGFNFVAGGNIFRSGITRAGVFVRAGWCHLGSHSFETGVRYTIDVPFGRDAEYVLFDPISLVFIGDAWPHIGY